MHRRFKIQQDAALHFAFDVVLERERLCRRFDTVGINIGMFVQTAVVDMEYRGIDFPAFLFGLFGKSRNGFVPVEIGNMRP